MGRHFFIYPVPQNAPYVSAGMNVPNIPEGQRPKATDVSPRNGFYKMLEDARFEFVINLKIAKLIGVTIPQ